MKKWLFFFLFLLMNDLLISNAFANLTDNKSYIPSQDRKTNHARLNNPESFDYDSIELSPTQKIVPKIKKEKNSKLYYTINIAYPQIEGKNLTEGQDAFNLRLQKIVEEEAQQFKNSIQLDLLHSETLPKEIRKNTFRMDYDLDMIPQLSVVSIRLTMESMQAGRAHPRQSHRVLNYDLAHNKEIALNDLFKPKADYLKTIAEYCHKKLNETVNEKDKWMIAEGTKPNVKNYKNWNIEEDAILITFDEYQVAPYVYGPQEVEIPFSELHSLLSSQGEMIASAKEEYRSNIG